MVVQALFSLTFAHPLCTVTDIGHFKVHRNTLAKAHEGGEWGLEREELQ